MSIQWRAIFILVGGLVLVFVTNEIIMSVNLFQFARDESAKELQFDYKTNDRKLMDLVSVAYKTIETAYNESQDIEKLKIKKSQELKQVLDAVFSTVSVYYEDHKGYMDQDRLEQDIKNIVKNSRYAGDNYIWINDMVPTMVMHPIKPEMDGQDLSTYKDPAGTFLFNEMVKVCKESGEGMVSYMWTKPGEQDPKQKISYVRLLPGLNWILGTGAWLEDVEEEMRAQALGEIGGMRLADGNYFWIHDLNQVMVMHPTNPKLDGRVLDDATFNTATHVKFGIEGEREPLAAKENIFKAMNDVIAKSGQGYVTYLWPKPLSGGGVTKEPYPKQSFVRLFEPWGWVIGMGVYIDDIEAQAQAKEEAFGQSLGKAMTKAGVISLMVMALFAVALTWYLRRDLARPLRVLAEYAQAVSHGDLDAPLHGRFVAELARLKESIGAMIAQHQGRRWAWPSPRRGRPRPTPKRPSRAWSGPRTTWGTSTTCSRP